MGQADTAEANPRLDYIYEMLSELAAMAREEGLDALATVLEGIVRWRREPLDACLR